MTVPDFSTLNSDSIPQLSNEDLGLTFRACVHAMEFDRGVPDGTFELLDMEDVENLNAHLWQVYLKRMPKTEEVDLSYGDEETSEIQEASAALIREGVKRAQIESMVKPLGYDLAFEMVSIIEDWTTRYQEEESPDPA